MLCTNLGAAYQPAIIEAIQMFIWLGAQKGLQERIHRKKPAWVASITYVLSKNVTIIG